MEAFCLPRFAWTPERINENTHLNKYFISSNGDRTHNQALLQSQTCAQGHTGFNTRLVTIVLDKKYLLRVCLFKHTYLRAD